MSKKVGIGEEKQDMWGSRRGFAPGALKRGLMDHLRYTQGTIPDSWKQPTIIRREDSYSIISIHHRVFLPYLLAFLASRHLVYWFKQQTGECQNCAWFKASCSVD